jgi:hypothetical protein
MKKSLSLCALALSILAFPLAAAEVAVSTKASNFCFTDSGELNPDTPRFGVSASVSDRISSRLDGAVFFDRDPLTGNLLGARAAYHTSFLEISAGPTFGLLNSSGDKDSVKLLFQPGMGIGFKIALPGYFLATADTDFALPPASRSEGQAYLQRGELSAGFYLPNVLCTVKASQRTGSIAHALGDEITCVTDYGFYTEAFKKGSPFRISIDFIYRIMQFTPKDAASDPVKIGNLILGTGATWSPNTNMSFFAKMSGSLYSFTLNKKVDDLNKFMYDISLGARILTKSPKGIE